ncbi:hypothetical protein BS50DRAFT_389646 [Corynespora cassiicola Philippines]|uniref:Uncharacterized protein n=1 Tax=Corynespora cassiicola Philippines TaxID=1448308 RepID=A0A2T2NPH4_CORCC|nr:hypothetical protein BS50DRAFT_389646 [Corynespora cassiicola Philippines]
MPGFKKAVTDTMDWRALHETAFTSQAQCESQHSRACSDWCARSIHSVTTFLGACRFHWPRLFTCRRHSSVNTAPSSTPPLHLSATPTRPHAPQKYRTRFAQIRAQWERVQPPATKLPMMAGRKDKLPGSQHPDADESSGGPSRFRRKLSQTMLLISNPLSQRKTSSNRQSSRPSLTSNGSTKSSSASQDDGTISTVPRNSTPLDYSDGSSLKRATPSGLANARSSLDVDVTPKALPRSRTLSFIPRPTGRASQVSETVSTTRLTKICTKIPTICPPAEDGRSSSPRQYMNTNTSLEAKPVAANVSFAEPADSSPSKASVHSYTTPNILKDVRSSSTNRTNAPRRSILKNKAVPPDPGMQMCKENNPIGLQAHNSPRESKLAINIVPPPPGASGRRYGQSNELVHRTTEAANSVAGTFEPPTLSTSRSPMSSGTNRTSLGGSIVQPHLMRPMNPPTPPAYNPAAVLPALSKVNTEQEPRRHLTMASSRSNSVGVPSRSKGTMNTEVRLPRSTTIHDFAKHHESNLPVRNDFHDYQAVSQPLIHSSGTEDPGPLYCSPMMSPELEAITEQDSPAKSEAVDPSSSPFASITDEDQKEDPMADDHSEASTTSTVIRHRLQPIDRPLFPVKDRMGPSWWSGRFSAKFDAWRISVMKADSDPDYKPEGLLEMCSATQEDLAKCYILLQLRDMCKTKLAADSLWEFERAYRQKHKLPNTFMAPPPAPRLPPAQPGAHKQGPISRAVRKLTPRKSSLVNLFKGKG